MIYVKEKILLYGGSNSGKTHAALRFAFEVISAGKRVFVMDADDSVPKLIQEMAEFEPIRDLMDTPSFVVRPVYDYDDARASAEYFRNVFKPKQGDLVVCEMIGNYWDWAQAEFARDVKNQTMAEIQKDKAENGRLQYGGLDGRSEWPIIKGLYFDVTTPMLQSPAHYIWTASSKALLPGMERPDIQEMFGAVGLKPEGQKDVHFKMDSIFYLGYDRKTGQRTWTTVKERGRRERMSNIPYSDLFSEYYAGFDLTPPWAVS